MTTPGYNDSARNPHVNALVRLAEEAGCQLRPQLMKEKQLRGLCPFHDTSRMQSANTLIVNTRTGNFHCQFCKIKGTPATFAALIWGVAVAEASQMLEHPDGKPVSLDRPTPVAMRPKAKSHNPNYRLQNTNLLSKAADYYNRNVAGSYPALNYLTRLGIPLHKTELNKVGYVKGWGLLEHLQETDTTAAEIRDSSLFETHPNGDVTERFHSAITLPDLDIIRATRWFLLVPPACPDPGRGWPKVPANTINLPGQRPFLFGYTKIPRRIPYLVVTDDARIQLLLQTEDIPCCHTLGRNDAGKIAERLLDKEPRSITLALHNRLAANALESSLRQSQPGLKMQNLPLDDFMAWMEPATRNLSVIGSLAPPRKSDN